MVQFSDKKQLSPNTGVNPLAGIINAIGLLFSSELIKKFWPYYIFPVNFGCDDYQFIFLGAFKGT